MSPLWILFIRLDYCFLVKIQTHDILWWFYNSYRLVMHVIDVEFLLMLLSQELARDRLMIELAREHAMSIDASKDARAKATSLGSAAVGASVGAGLGIVLAIVMGAASALRKP